MQVENAAMEKCPFPGCNRSEHDEGHHDSARPARPAGELRKTYTFATDIVPCDLQVRPKSHARAIGFFVDELGFGWSLCGRCTRRFAQ